MIEIKEGFKGSRQLQLSESTLDQYSNDEFVGNLYIRKVGVFPAVKYHYMQKDSTCPYNIILYCTNGERWCYIDGHKYILKENQYIILPKKRATHSVQTTKILGLSIGYTSLAKTIISFVIKICRQNILRRILKIPWKLLLTKYSAYSV